MPEGDGISTGGRFDLGCPGTTRPSAHLYEPYRPTRHRRDDPITNTPPTLPASGPVTIRERIDAAERIASSGLSTLCGSSASTGSHRNSASGPKLVEPTRVFAETHGRRFGARDFCPVDGDA